MEQHIDEIKLVDYVLNKLDHDENEKVKRHLAACESCLKEMEHWRTMLEAKRFTEPSKLLDKRIERITKRKTIPLRKETRRKRLYIASGFVALFLFAIGLYAYVNDQANDNHDIVSQGYIIAQHDEVPEQQLLMQPETDRQPVVSLTNQKINGELWLNKETNELVFLADGLKPLQANDYQLWVVHVDDYWNGQLLQLRNGTTRVYYKAEDISLLKYLKVSVEPQGGSLTPTGPEIFHVDLIENNH